MKKIIFGILLSLTTLTFLSACGENKASTQESTTASSSAEVASDASVFTGVLAEEATTSADGSIQLKLTDVEAINDPEEISKSFANDGVILNVSEEQFAASFDANDYKTGATVRFTLQGMPIMTMSIPPQIPGNSIQTVELGK